MTPECQTIVPKLKTDIVEIFEACVNGNLNSINLDWYNDKVYALCFVQEDTPKNYENNIEIQNLKI